jgi:hypothetical protein
MLRETFREAKRSTLKETGRRVQSKTTARERALRHSFYQAETRSFWRNNEPLGDVVETLNAE